MQSQRVYLVFVPDQHRPVPQVFLSWQMAWHLNVKEVILMQEEASMGLLLLSNRANGFCSNLSKLLVFWPGEALQVRKALLLLLTVPFGDLALSSHRGSSRCLLSSCLYLLQNISQQSRQSCMMLYWEWGGQPVLPAGWRAQRGGSGKTGCVPPTPTPTAWRQEVPHLLPCCFVPLLASDTCCSTHFDPCFGVGSYAAFSWCG